MKTATIALVLSVTMSVGANVEARNVHGTGAGGFGTAGAKAAAANAGSIGAQGQGGNRPYTLGDEFQPWPQADMQQYAKPRWVPYDGK
jgi:hypothetical protein